MQLYHHQAIRQQRSTEQRAVAAEEANATDRAVLEEAKEAAAVANARVAERWVEPDGGVPRA